MSAPRLSPATSTPLARRSLLAAALAAPAAARAAATPWNAVLMRQRHAEIIDAWNRHDAEAAAAAYRRDGVRVAPHAPDGLRGAAIVADTRGTFAAFPDFHAERVWVDVAGDDRLVAQLTISGHWTGTPERGYLAGRSPSGRGYQLSAMEMLVFSDGLLTSAHLYYDRLSLLTQIGALTV